MIVCTRTDSGNPDFQQLVQKLDADLLLRDGEDHAFFAQFNKIDVLRYVVVAYEDDVPVGCGALKPYDHDTMEVKRMYVLPEQRGRKIATQVLKTLECWAQELQCQKCILETGEKQPEAIALYHSNQYTVIPNFGPYAGVAESICFEKRLVL